MQAHHMIDAQDSREPEVVTDIGGDIAVALSPNPLGMQRRESPVLAGREERIGRGAGRDTGGESISLAPDVVAIWIYAQR